VSVSGVDRVGMQGTHPKQIRLFILCCSEEQLVYFLSPGQHRYVLIHAYALP